MDYWSVYESREAQPEFGRDRLLIASRDRIHLSLSTVENVSIELGMNRAMSRGFSEAARYVLATDITHDLLVSIYDVNTTHASLLRFSQPLAQPEIKRVADAVRKLRKPNLEMRIIGLQNTETELLGSVEMLQKRFSSSLMEVDLFGADTRHIAIDLKLGMSFNLLLLNRIYRPHELVSTLAAEEFNKRRSALKFI